MTAANEDLVLQVCQLIDQARQAGQPTPGRPKLVKLTGATDHAVRKALSELATTKNSPEEIEPPKITRKRSPGPWPLLLIGLAAAVAVWSGWVGLGRMAGFGVIQPLPGIWDSLQINTAVVLPISVEAYAAYALRCWLGGSQFSARTKRFARWSAVSSLAIGAGAQVAYHLMAAAGLERAPWQITMLVACVPVVVLGLASALAKLVTSDHQATDADGPSRLSRLDLGV
ncbi:hypothetical protein ACPZ19_48930 [Amycolatopsis lurida]